MDELLRGEVMTTVAETSSAGVPQWLRWLLPLALVGVMAGVLTFLDPIGWLREAPPIESVAIERTVLEEGHVRLSVRNDGPDPVTIAQVLVDDTYWNFTATDSQLDRLEASTIDIDYPWDEGLPLTIGLVTETGVVIEHEIEAAVVTPQPDARILGIYALLGIYIGVIPIAVGLLWWPALRRAGDRWIAFFLAFTIGLLAFLLVDTVAEGLELSAATGSALDGLGLFAVGAALAVIALSAISERLPKGAGKAGLAFAYLVAAGIGLHNLGEGLAVGTALAVGELGLGTSLVLGFALHNTTEGLAIVAPFGSNAKRPAIRHFIALGAIAGVPTIAGAWMGGFAYNPAVGAVAFGVAAGAIAQVVWQIATSRPGMLSKGLGPLGFVAGLLTMYATGLLVAA
ncbi:MAG TPA: ZIP family metal transporter [Actinomycetota bacterium]|nr:ZIP family metal transporter [Actinomycetota bacterium]